MAKRKGSAQAVYNASGITLTDGDETGLFVNGSGFLLAAFGEAFAGEDIPNDVMKTENRFTNTRVTADTKVAEGVGLLHRLIVTQPASATPTAGVLTIYNSTTETGDILFQHYFPASAVAVPVPIEINAIYTVGLYVGFDATLAGLAFNIEAR